MSSSSAVTSSSPSTSSPETHSCPYADCNKSFSKKYNLKAHLRLHTGEQPFECDRPDCRKKFKWRSSLSSHSVWHSRKDNAAASATTVTKSSTISKSNSQKTGASRAARVATPAAAARQLCNTQNSCSSASVTSPSSRKKRPRSEMSGCTTESGESANQESCGSSSTSRVRTKSKGCSAKKQRRTKMCGTGNTSVGSSVPVQQNESILKEEVESYETCLVDDGSFEMMPGSPVTSDGSFSEAALNADEFSCDILQPLLSRGDTLELDSGSDVLFGYEEAACGSLTGFDTRFEHLDLDNFGNLYLNRLESL